MVVFIQSTRSELHADRETTVSSHVGIVFSCNVFFLICFKEQLYRKKGMHESITVDNSRHYVLA